MLKLFCPHAPLLKCCTRYNSAVFETTGGNLYRMMLVSTDNVESSHGRIRIASPDTFPDDFDFSGYKPVSNRDCIDTYSAALLTNPGNPGSYVTNAGSVVAVSSDPNMANNTVYAYGSSVSDMLYAKNFTEDSLSTSTTTHDYIPVGLLWVCKDHLSLNSLEQEDVTNCVTRSLGTDAAPWTIDGYAISYCLVEELPIRCSVEFSTTIMGFVVLGNVLKVACMVYVILRVQHDPLVTVGDAIASFLSKNDAMTQGRCLLSKKDAQKKSYMKLYGSDGSEQWQGHRNRWVSSVGWIRWSFLTVL